MSPSPLHATIDGCHITLDDALIAKYDRPLPRYTSYPPAPAWGPLGPDEYVAALRSLSPPGRGQGEGRISLYLHIPFCAKRCLFCGCNSIATTNREAIARYVQACRKELHLVARTAGARLRIAQIHFGGGTPTSVGLEGLAEILGEIRDRCDVLPDAEQAIELDPRMIDPRDIDRLCALGFNRMSFGVQDFDPDVNASSGRASDFEAVRGLIDAARGADVSGINTDLIYGLPRQTPVSWGRTLRQVVDLRPDRIALFNFAYLPKALPHQRRIDPKLLPSGKEKLALFAAAIEHFQKEGYAYIGLDHFARAGDGLERAHREGRLTRNFQGYTAAADVPIVGVGVTAISELAALYAQNEKRLVRYLECVEGGRLATDRGIELTGEDVVRRSVVRDILCRQRVDKRAFAKRWGADFDEKFSGAKAELRSIEADGLVIDAPEALVVTPLGRLFIRAAAATLDSTLGRKQALYSRGV